jgi:uncharacterized repeat protein (TIGR01451 family)
MRSSSSRLLTVAVLAAAVLAVGLAAALPAAAQPPAFQAVVTARTNNPGFSGGADFGLTVGVPPGPAGDLLIFLVGVKINPATTTPAGWTPIVVGFNDAICDSDPDGLGIRCQLSAFWRISDGTESDVSVVFGPNPRQAAGAVLRYSGADTTSPIGSHATQKGTSTTVVGPSVTTSEADNTVLFVALADGDEAQSLFTSEPPTQRFELASTMPFGPGSSFTFDAVVLAASDQPFPAAGPTGTVSWSLPAADEYRTLSIPIRPAGVVQDTDLAVAKSVDLAKVNPGGSLEYTIVVSNHGPADVAGATVSDAFDGDLTCTWTCSAAGASACGSAGGSGDLAEPVDVAVGDDVTFTASCAVDAGAAGTIGNTASVAVPAGFNDTDSGNDSDSTSTAVNQAPVAVCQDVELVADLACQADVTGSSAFDGGSSDPDGDLPLAFSHAPAGPYGLGGTAVTLTVEDALGLGDTCEATVTVVDQAAPAIQCNAPATITPPDAPITFTATATDNCSVASVVVDSYECFKHTRKGKKIDKGQSCVVATGGASVTLHDSGGVGDTIVWKVTAVDGSGNPITQSCTVEVVNPGNGP